MISKHDFTTLQLSFKFKCDLNKILLNLELMNESKMSQLEKINFFLECNFNCVATLIKS